MCLLSFLRNRVTASGSNRNIFCYLKPGSAYSSGRFSSSILPLSSLWGYFWRDDSHAPTILRHSIKSLTNAIHSPINTLNCYYRTNKSFTTLYWNPCEPTEQNSVFEPSGLNPTSYFPCDPKCSERFATLRVCLHLNASLWLRSSFWPWYGCFPL